MLLAGDVMPSRRLSPFNEDDYLALVEMVRGADVAFANLETTVRERHEGAPNFTQGTPMTTPPRLLDDLKWMGFDIVSCANNHATDYGACGVLASLAHLRSAGIPCAGSGGNLAEARAPAYVDTPAGRVGLVAATAFFRPWNRASHQRPDAPGRPGINPLGFSARYSVDDDALRTLRRISDGLGLTQERARHRAQFYSASEIPPEDANGVDLLGARFRRGNGFSVSTEVSRADADANLRWIREARRQADWVIFSFHFHEFGAAGRLTAKTDVEMEEPAQFVTEFARAAVEAGADVVAGHGPHLTLGVEIYRGRPILYSLGNFVFQTDTVDIFPSESYERFGLGHDATPADFLDARTGNDTRGFPASPEFWESFIATCEFRGRNLTALRLHPIDLGHGKPRAQRGRPVLARGEVADRILQRLQRLSARHGADVTVEGATGVVRMHQ
ncbi:MAG: CapA family protein [Betaproteobacteria bacterium]|nr:CapA family protein [Betaproteobacteria bacterium]